MKNVDASILCRGSDIKKKTTKTKTKAKQTNKKTLKLVVVRLVRVQVRTDFVILVDNAVLWNVSHLASSRTEIWWTLLMNFGNHRSLIFSRKMGKLIILFIFQV